jgi:hypothetical protein
MYDSSTFTPRKAEKGNDERFPPHAFLPFFLFHEAVSPSRPPHPEPKGRTSAEIEVIDWHLTRENRPGGFCTVRATGGRKEGRKEGRTDGRSLLGRSRIITTSPR